MRWFPAKIAALLTVVGCAAPNNPPVAVDTMQAPVREQVLRTGAERTDAYLPLLAGRRVGVVTNATGMIGKVHLVDSLLASGVNVVKVFAPEHGFRGTADAGELVADARDPRTGLPIVSLYGKHKEPSKEQLADVDVLLFDIQDVGVRFYTYVGTLHYVMQAAAREGRKVVVLDRPDPHGAYIDGPILDTAHRSFVGMHPVPLVHGLTIGEYGRMINGERWLKGGVTCDLEVVPCEGYRHAMNYVLPVRPSPNLPNATAVMLYPSLGLFEGTPVSVGRGTDIPFQCAGRPGSKLGGFHFTPEPRVGAKDPPHKGVRCTGYDLSHLNGTDSTLTRIDLQWLLAFYGEAADKKAFFTKFFDKLAGGTSLRLAIQSGMNEEQIRASWRPGLEAFQKVRAKYLLYE